jgi:hypothetical protein
VEVVGGVVLDVRRGGGHQAREDLVEDVEEGAAGAEVGLEVDDFAGGGRRPLTPALAQGRRRRSGICAGGARGSGRMRFELRVTLQEARGLGEAEAVDGLLDVADREQVGGEGRRLKDKG